MNKRELIGIIAEKTSLSKKSVDQAFTEIFESIKDAMAEGDKVAIKGFGTFGSRNRAAKIGRHPKTGKKINIPARKVPTFSAGSALKESVMTGTVPKKAPPKKKAVTPKKKSTAPKKKGKKK